MPLLRLLQLQLQRLLQLRLRGATVNIIKLSWITQNGWDQLGRRRS